MVQNSTYQLLVLHAYGETTEAQKMELAEAVAKNESLHEELMEMLRAKKELNNSFLSPSETSIRIIMDYSHKTEHLQEIQ
jgi:hypothetical protein